MWKPILTVPYSNKNWNGPEVLLLIYDFEENELVGPVVGQAEFGIFYGETEPRWDFRCHDVSPHYGNLYEGGCWPIAWADLPSNDGWEEFMK